MGQFTKIINSLWRDSKTDGVPASGANEPNKFDIRSQLGPALDTAFASAQQGMAVYATSDDLPTDPVPAEGTQARVYADDTDTNNGVWIYKDGAWAFDSDYYDATVPQLTEIRDETKAWAISPDEPDPTNAPGDQSAKTYATQAGASAAVAGSAATDIVNGRFGPDTGIVTFSNSKYSHAFTDNNGVPFMFVLRDGGALDFAASSDMLDRIQAMFGRLLPVGSSREVDGYLSGWRLPLFGDDGNIFGGFDRNGDLVARLSARSVVPAAVVGAAVADLLASARLSPPSGRLWFSGDSLTAGAGGNGTTYPGVMAAALGLPYYNSAVGGTRSGSIAVRQGGKPMLVTLDDNMIPATTDEVLITAYSDELTNNQSSQAWTCTLAGVQGTITRYGRDDDAGVTDHYTFKRAAAGDAVEVDPQTRVDFDVYEGNEDDWHYIQSGQNNDKSTPALRMAVRDDILRMIDRLGHDRFGVLALKPVSAGEAAEGSDKRETNMLIEQAVGWHYIDTGAYLSSYYGLAEQDITPTGDDDAAIAAGYIPPSLISPTAMSPHGTPDYYTIEGNFMARWHRGHAF
jgi:hypothetical protein